MSRPLFQVVVIDDGGERVFEWDGQATWTFGRGDTCEIPLATPRASRRHFELSSDGATVRVRDLGSANGTVVDGHKVSELDLPDGGAIQVGSAVIRVARISASATPVAQSPEIGSSVEPAPATPTSAIVPPRTSSAAIASTATPDAAKRASEDPRTPGAEPREARAESDPRTPVSRAAGEGAEAVSRRRAMPAPKSSPTSPAVASILLVVAAAVFVGVIFLLQGQFGRVEWARNDRETRNDSGAGDPTRGVGLTGVGGVAGEGDATEPPSVDESLLALATLHDRVRTDGVGWEVADEYRIVAEQYRGQEGGDRARQFVSLIERLREMAAESRRDVLDSAIEARARDARFGEALVLVDFARDTIDPGIVNRTEAESYWDGRRNRVLQRAAIEFSAVEREVAEVVAAGRAADALRSLVGMRDRWGGLPGYENLVGRLIESTERESTRPDAAGLASRELRGRLREQIGIAFEACRFRELSPLFERLAGIAESDSERAEAYRGLFDADTLVDLFDEFLAAVGKNDIETNSGRLVRATAEIVEFERSLNGGTLQFVTSWSQMTPVQKLELFEKAVFSAEGVHGAIRYAERVGADEFAERFLVRLYRRVKGKQLAAVIASRRRGIEVPEEGFEVFEDRLVTAAEKVGILADRRAAKEREKALVAELARESVEAKLLEAIDIALELREEGRFSLAQRALEEIAQKSTASARDRAIEILENPVLRFRTIRDRGQSSNRVDIVVLGEGYPVEDDYQESFGVQANTLVNLLSKEEPYKNYADYFNFHVGYLGSKDRGVDRYPGDVERDTPLDGKVEWDRFTVNNGLVQEILATLGEAGADGQAIALGNDLAGVATGGGGVAAITKGNYAVAGHEIGHSLGGLHDEYDFEPGTDPDRPKPGKRRENVPPAQLPPNLMAGSNYDSIVARGILWQHWIDAGEDAWWNGQKVDLFEGGNRQPFNFWRPQQNCKMRSAGSRFCVVCMEAMILRIYEICRPIDRIDPEPEAAGDEIPITRIEKGQKRVFQVWPMMPVDHDLKCEWYLLELGANRPTPEKEETGPTRTGDRGDGKIFLRTGTYRDLDDRIVHAAEMRVKDLRPGYYRLRCRVTDETPWVIRDGRNLMTQVQDWFIEVPRD